MLDYFKISAWQMLVVHDDLDLHCGRIKLVRRGAAAGHRGVSSVIEYVKSQNFPRLKMGIGRPCEGEPIEAYVLQKPYPHETVIFEEMVTRGAEAAHAVLFSDLEEVMNRFNRRDPRTEGI
jgi:PTH1 family peptidyl-tRNA hydrolase